MRNSIITSYIALLFIARALSQENQLNDSDKTQDSIRGYWQHSKDPSVIQVFLKDRMLCSQDDELLILPVAKYTPDQITIPDLGPALGRGYKIRYQQKGDNLTIINYPVLKNGNLTWANNVDFHRLAERPPGLNANALPLRSSFKLDKKIIAEITTSLSDRMKRDQSSRRSGSYATEAKQAQAGDVVWLKETISKYGWIDSKRFGVNSTQAAFLIAQHCLDIRLRLAAEEGIKKEMTHGAPLQGMYVWLHDRTSLYLNSTQKYGTHFLSKPAGTIRFLPLEDPTRIDRWRKDLNFSSFTKVLAEMEKQMGKDNVTVLPTLTAE